MAKISKLHFTLRGLALCASIFATVIVFCQIQIDGIFYKLEVGIVMARPQNIDYHAQSLSSNSTVASLRRDFLPDGVVSGHQTSRDSVLTIGMKTDLRTNISCVLRQTYDKRYAECQRRFFWMQSYWRSDIRYAKWGVDGSNCSILAYLSLVEHHCPLASQSNGTDSFLGDSRVISKRTIISQGMDSAMAHDRLRLAPTVPRYNISNLLSLMLDNEVNYGFMKKRLQQMWPAWLSALGQHKLNTAFIELPKKNVFLHLGLLTRESGFKIAELSLKGGPLGELVQWSDLIACLYLLGHDLSISSDKLTLKAFINGPSGADVDLIFTDITGLGQLKRELKGNLGSYQCLVRVIDSFGTEAEFNNQKYYTAHKAVLGLKGNPWGGHGLNLKQFYTMFPLSHDNSFLGFAINIGAPTTDDRRPSYDEPWALVYGKELYMWEDQQTYLNIIADLVEIHATLATHPNDSSKGQVVPEYVTNHGLLSGKDVRNLLRNCSVFLGLGFPFEGPAPLEAIASGAVFINPMFPQPKSRLNDDFFAVKPTLRALHSQNPYLRDFVGPPYVLTVDVRNASELRNAVRRAIATDVPPFLPFEFTPPGMLERVNAFARHQDFCSGASTWPPLSAMKLILGSFGESCQRACWSKNLICEQAFFPHLNSSTVIRTTASFSRMTTCRIVNEETTLAPYVMRINGSCILQRDPLLYSCSSANQEVQRICPCRDYVQGQTALCADCL